MASRNGHRICVTCAQAVVFAPLQEMRGSAMKRRLVFLSLVAVVVLGIGGVARATTPDKPHGKGDDNNQPVTTHTDTEGGQVDQESAPDPTAGGALTGSVKIDDVDLDDLPANSPHQACQLRVAVQHPGDEPLQLTFEAQPPTTRTGDDQVLFTTVVPGGADSSEVIDLTSALEGITPQPNQGFHVKLTVAPVDLADHPAKHKVFWVQACPAPAVTPSNTPTPTPAVVPTQVLGEQFTKPPAAAPVPQGELAFTGSPLSPVLAFLLIGAGVLLQLFVRRPSAVPVRVLRRR
jgi:hypothetical protein